MKLQDLIRQLSETLEHWGGIEVDCLDFEVIAVPIPEKENEDVDFILRFTTSATEVLTELSEEVYSWDDERGFYHPSHAYLDSVAKKINEALPTNDQKA